MDITRKLKKKRKKKNKYEYDKETGRRIHPLIHVDEATAKENAEATDKFDVADVTAVDIEDNQTALIYPEKIDPITKNVKGLDEHDEEMDDIQQAVDRSAVNELGNEC